MNAIWIVLPILTLLMFDLGLEVKISDFTQLRHRPRPVVAGMAGQIVLLPLLAIGLGMLFELEPLFFTGLVLIACSPGGSSSNVFTMIVRGDVALSVSLTALSSIITLFTIPVVMEFATRLAAGSGTAVELPVGSLIAQNLLLSLLPVTIGVAVRHRFPAAAQRIHSALSRIAFPALMLLAGIFFVQYRDVIAEQSGRLGACVASLILLAMSGGFALSRLMRLDRREQRTLVIEIGMQNAAQSIALAASPFVFNNDIIAIPAILYALLMNVFLLTYAAILKFGPAARREQTAIKNNR